jgi:hypothetical protein
VKTINYSEEDSIFQTDTGPVLLPDLSAQRLATSSRLIECFDMAFAAFNSRGWTEYIVNVPTDIGGGMSVNHYSKVRRIEPVANSLFEVLAESPQWHVEKDRTVRIDGAQLIPTISVRGPDGFNAVVHE